MLIKMFVQQNIEQADLLNYLEIPDSCLWIQFKAHFYAILSIICLIRAENQYFLNETENWKFMVVS
jgi:hypothetical protein